jgi:hypothetical protein
LLQKVGVGLSPNKNIDFLGVVAKIDTVLS